jgi:hypothetical protein
MFDFPIAADIKARRGASLYADAKPVGTAPLVEIGSPMVRFSLVGVMGGA